MDERELKALATSNHEKIRQTLDNGDIEGAKVHLDTMEEESKHAHDVMCDYVASLVTYIGANYGDEEVMKAFYFRHSIKDQVSEKMLGLSAEDAVRYKTMVHRGHHSNMELTEEKDRFVLKLDPCNSGGTIRREYLDAPPEHLGKIKTGIPESWNRTDISYYCAHCGIHSRNSVKKGAPHPTWIYECPDDPNSPCIQYCYKNTEDVPEKYFEELGLVKPKN